jgi:hypothetical protein
MGAVRSERKSLRTVVVRERSDPVPFEPEALCPSEQARLRLDGKAGIEASATAALNRSTLPRGRETRCWVPLPTCFVRSEEDGSEDVNLLAPCSADPDLPPLADRPPSPSLAASGA